MTSNLVLEPVFCLPSVMVRISQSGLRIALFLVVIPASIAAAASKPHTVTFGKWMTVQWFPSPSAVAGNTKPLTLKVRPILVDARVKDFTLGPAHDVTDRMFVVRRAFRLNDSLPQESSSPPRWQWQRGGWLLVDRVSGHISSINLPEFDAFYSTASWYRDYAAYCGISDDGKKIYAIVAQISRRKPVLKKLIDGASGGDAETKDKDKDENALPDSACPVPAWQRAPIRVTFEPAGVPTQTFAILGHAVDLVNQDEEDDQASKK
ncbi:MAG: hypothetical protein WA623_11160 [Candidatus Sulfotelmatobacter sp.]